MKKTDLYTGLSFMALSVFMMVFSFQVKIIPSSRISSRIMPQILAVLIFAISLSLVIKAIRQLKGMSNTANATPTPEMLAHRAFIRKRVLGTFVLIFGYVFILEPLGFVLDTILYLFLQISLFIPRAKFKWYKILMIAVVSTCAIYGLFYYGFNLMIPNGILG